MIVRNDHTCLSRRIAAVLTLGLLMLGSVVAQHRPAAGASISLPVPSRPPHVQVVVGAASSSALGSTPALSSDPMAGLRADAADLRQLMQSTRDIMALYAKDTPSPVELAAIHAQLVVIRERMARLDADAQVVHVALSTQAGAPASVAPAIGGSAWRLEGLRIAEQVAVQLRALLTDPAADTATVEVATAKIAQLEALVAVIQGAADVALVASDVQVPASDSTPPASFAPLSLGGSVELQTTVQRQAVMLRLIEQVLLDMRALALSPLGETTANGPQKSVVTATAPATPAVAAPIVPTARPQAAAPAGSIDVTVVPGPLHDPNLATLDFDIKLSTHSVDLSQDLTSISFLRLPSGLEAPAVSWQGPRGGHHVAGTLSFQARDEAGTPVLPAAGTLALVIRGLGGVPERVFVLELSQVQ